MFQPVEAFGSPFCMDKDLAGTVEYGAGNAQFLRRHIDERPETDALDPAGDDYAAGRSMQNLVLP